MKNKIRFILLFFTVTIFFHSLAWVAGRWRWTRSGHYRNDAWAAHGHVSYPWK